MNENIQDRLALINHIFEDKERLEAMTELIEKCSGNYFAVCDLETDMLTISRRTSEKFCVPEGEISFCTAMEKLVYPADANAVKKYFDKMHCVSGYSSSNEFRILKRDGSAVWVSCSIQCINGSDKVPRFAAVHIAETGEKQHSDNVTGLLREIRLQSDYGEINADSEGYLLRFGIDNFGEINENLGIAAGDRILRRLAKILGACADDGSSVYRLSGDGFLIMCPEGTEEGADSVYEKVRHKIQCFVEETDYRAMFTVSAGALCLKIKEMPFSEAMQLTEFALNQAKRSGKNRLAFFSAEEYRESLKKSEILRELRRDVKNGCKGMRVFFQPIVNARTCEITGAEALLRWTNEKLGSIPPYVFVPLLEDSNLIIPVGKWVAEVSARTCKKWQERIPHFKININLSYIQIKKSDIMDDIAAALESCHLPPNSIVIEMTESGYIDADANFRQLFGKIKQMDMQLAIDDFGTGYSNLRYLKDMHADTLKIDRSFVCRSLDSAYDYTVIKNIIEMAHSIGLKICLEGIELPEELEKLKSLNPDYIQGFLFGRPMSEEDFYKDLLAVLP